MKKRDRRLAPERDFTQAGKVAGIGIIGATFRLSCGEHFVPRHASPGSAREACTVQRARHPLPVGRVLVELQERRIAGVERRLDLPSRLRVQLRLLRAA